MRIVHPPCDGAGQPLVNLGNAAVDGIKGGLGFGKFGLIDRYTLLNRTFLGRQNGQLLIIVGLVGRTGTVIDSLDSRNIL